MTSALPPLVQAISGAIGSGFANATSYPLDLVCTRLQTRDSREKQGTVAAVRTLQQVISAKGIAGLYDGLETDTAATLVSNFFYFFAYSSLRTVVSRRGVLTAIEEISIGFLAGVASRAISTPLNLITVRLQNERESTDTDNGTIIGVVRCIYAEHGLKGFWRGFKTTMLLCLNPSVTFFLFQAFRRLFLRGKDKKQPSPRQAFLGAAFSNAIAVALLYPLMLAKTRLQSVRKESKSDSHSMLDVWRSAYSRDGFTGLYQGLEAHIVKGFLNQGLTMMTKQRLEQMIISLYLYRIRQKRSQTRQMYFSNVVLQRSA